MSRIYTARKTEYFARLKGMFAEYSRCFVVCADNVGSFQMQQVRIALRGTAQVIFGKNTMMRKVLDAFMEENPGHPMEALKVHMQVSRALSELPVLSPCLLLHVSLCSIQLINFCRATSVSSSPTRLTSARSRRSL